MTYKSKTQKIIDRKLNELVQTFDPALLSEREQRIAFIKLSRANAGLTQQDFALKLCVSIRTVQSWELGERVCPEMGILLIENVINYDPSRLEDTDLV